MGVMYEDTLTAIYGPLIEQGRIIYHGDLARTCLNIYYSSECLLFESESDSEPMSEYRQACLDMLEGTIPTGGQCSLDAECAGEAFCRLDTACPGTCSALGAVGDSCEYDDQCQSGIVCSYDSSQCVQPSPAGGPCASDEECQTGLVCGYATSLCVAPQPAGAVCDYDDLRCGEGLSCEPNDADPTAPSTCVATSIGSDEAVSAGEACDMFVGPSCTDGLRCVFLTSPYGEGVCSDVTAAAGASCQAAYPSQCPTGYYCDAVAAEGLIDGTCQPTPQVGDPCADGEVFAPACPLYATCVADICQPMQRVGGSCEDDDQCYTSLCADSVCSADPCADFEPSTNE